MTQAPHRLTRTEARRIAVRAQLLDAPRREELGVVELLRHLMFLQADPTKAVAKNADLVIWSRTGSRCPYGAVDQAFEDDELFELRDHLRVAEDIALYRDAMNQWPGPHARDWEVDQRAWLEANADCRQDILHLLEVEGPLPTRQLPDTTVVPWQSSGWNNNRSVRMLVSLMVQCGDLGMAGYRGRDRLWDLAERVYPDSPTVPQEEAEATLERRRLHSLGIARATGPHCVVESGAVGAAGEPAVVDGVRGTWRVDPAYLEGTFEGRTAILSPLDRLVFDRKRMEDLFEFDYQLEMYKPAAKRRWGYWAMPILDGDRLVGKVDATTEWKHGVLRVDAVHEDRPFSKALRSRVQRELRDLAQWLGVHLQADRAA